MMEDCVSVEAIFNVLGTLSMRLTGQTFLICMKDEEGNISHVYPNDSGVTWINHQGEAVPPDAGHQVSGDMHCPLHGVQYAKQIEPEPVPQQTANGVR
ncbi:MAG: hypothetical protein J4N34_02770 [Chloroflexi bacterium]|nr:hypothetical protein [Chloroflexota bacterium]